MSITYCPHCSTLYDQDYNVEHEEECEEEQREIPMFQESMAALHDVFQAAEELIKNRKS